MTEKIVEGEKRLSQSILWKLQQDAYCQFGIDAWNQHGVPSYITSNSYTARCYAQVVLGYLRDCVANGSIDCTNPLYILDLGAGTGRLAYLFLQEIVQYLKSSSLPTIKLCYVMTDIVPSNLTFWQLHPSLKPYFEQGLLDCAIYHHDQKGFLHLTYRNETLSKEKMVNPLVLICNYFFDTIPQDLFRVKGGQLEEGCITLSVQGEEPINPSIINKLEYRYSYHPLPSQPYYENPAIDALLQSHGAEFEGCSFLMPVGGFQAMDTFIEWSKSRLMVIAGDKGAKTAEQFRRLGEPKMNLHGSFSFPVNFYALAKFFPVAFRTSFLDSSFGVMVGLVGASVYSETALAFQEQICSFEPCDYFNAVSLEETRKEIPLDTMLLLIKLGNWDASVLLTFFSAIRKAIPTATEVQKQVLCETISRVWDHFYSIGPPTGDFVLNLGVLLFELQRFGDAKTYFDRAVAISGVTSAALRNIGACHEMLGNPDEARNCKLQAFMLQMCRK